MRKIARFFGKALYNAFLAVFGISLVGATIAIANYTVTQGAGTTFGSIAVATINYAQMLVCDQVAPAQCVTIKAASTAAVATDQALVVAVSPNNTAAVTQSGTWTVQPGNTANTTPWLVDERQMGGTTISGSCVSNYGTAPGAVACPSMNSFVTNALTSVADNADGVAVANPFGTPIVNHGYAFNGTTWDRIQDDANKNLKVVLQSTAAGGATPYAPFVPAASDNHQTVKNGAGTAYSVVTSNNSATKNYLRLYDSGTGFNGCNSATGVIFAMEIPPTDSGFVVTLGGASGISFTNGLSLCVTSGFGLTDVTNATATAMYVNVAYK
jgi:hypothetical protein